jgi:hypothetical protein
MVDRRRQAQALVNAWGRDDADLVKVYGFHIIADRESEPADFLIVSGSAVPTGSVEPFGFGPSKSVPFPTRIAEVSTDEFEARKSEQGYLPNDWRLSDAVELSPER